MLQRGIVRTLCALPFFLMAAFLGTLGWYAVESEVFHYSEGGRGSSAVRRVAVGTDAQRVGLGLLGLAAAGAFWGFLMLCWAGAPKLKRGLLILSGIFLVLAAVAFFPPWMFLTETLTTVFYMVLSLGLAGAASVRGLKGREKRSRLRGFGAALIVTCLAAAAIGGAAAGRGIGSALFFACAFAVHARFLKLFSSTGR